MPTIITLPRIVAVTGVDDAGPSDHGQGNASCPHCGADGRYTYIFITEDGARLGAMRGCLSLYPRTALADALTHVFERELQARRERRAPTSWDRAVLDAVAQFARHEIDLPGLTAVVTQQDRARRQYLDRRFGGRGRAR